jgi:hypothetical protein
MSPMTIPGKILGYAALALIGALGWLADHLGSGGPTGARRERWDPRDAVAPARTREALGAAAATACEVVA